jgi:23S rRNA (pseudouridine1915-N3)-methyltransferase
MKITVLAVGRIREKFYSEAAAEYVKRLGRYAKTEILEVADEPTPEGASAKEEEQIREKEGARILARIPDGAYVTALAIEGKAMDSVAFSEKIQTLGLAGSSHICFIIGGSLGLSPAVLHRADELLSFSKMTFPHQLMRVILLEQVYRAFRIARGEPYHK